MWVWNRITNSNKTKLRINEFIVSVWEETKLKPDHFYKWKQISAIVKILILAAQID